MANKFSFWFLFIINCTRIEHITITIVHRFSKIQNAPLDHLHCICGTPRKSVLAWLDFLDCFSFQCFWCHQYFTVQKAVTTKQMMFIKQSNTRIQIILPKCLRTMEAKQVGIQHHCCYCCCWINSIFVIWNHVFYTCVTVCVHNIVRQIIIFLWAH